MKTVILSIFICFVCLSGYGQSAKPMPQGKVFPIHVEKRILKHEWRGKRHDFRKFRQHRHRAIKRAIRRHRFGR